MQLIFCTGSSIISKPTSNGINHKNLKFTLISHCQPRPFPGPDNCLIIWLTPGWEFPAAALNITLGWVDEDGCIADNGSLGPNGNIICPWLRCMNEIWGWTCWVLPYPEMLGCEDEGGITCGLLLPMLLLTIEEAIPAGFICEVDPAAPTRLDRMRFRSAVNLCLAFSTCSHSLIRKVSTSANCFSFSSNLFNWFSSNMVNNLLPGI